MNSSKLFFIVVFAPISFNIETFLLLDLDLDRKRMCDAEDSVCVCRNTKILIPVGYPSSSVSGIKIQTFWIKIVSSDRFISFDSEVPRPNVYLNLYPRFVYGFNHLGFIIKKVENALCLTFTYDLFKYQFVEFHSICQDKRISVGESLKKVF